jgi:hypothetical protein
MKYVEGLRAHTPGPVVEPLLATSLLAEAYLLVVRET